MELVFTKSYEIKDNMVDCFGFLRPAQMLFIAQDVAGKDFEKSGESSDVLALQRRFWAVVRQRVQITRTPRSGETLRVETWAMPPKSTYCPRSVVAYDEKGRECFSVTSVWVIMDLDTRELVPMAKSGIQINGVLRGTELAVPKGLKEQEYTRSSLRTVRYSDIDRNEHMNNTRYLEWVDDLFSVKFHREHTLREMIVDYRKESREGDTLDLRYGIWEDNTVQVDAHRTENGEDHRVFSARLLYV